MLTSALFGSSFRAASYHCAASWYRSASKYRLPSAALGAALVRIGGSDLQQAVYLGLIELGRRLRGLTRRQPAGCSAAGAATDCGRTDACCGAENPAGDQAEERAGRGEDERLWLHAERNFGS